MVIITFLYPFNVFSSELMSIDGRPAVVKDIIQVRLRDLHPTQPSIGFDRVYYKLGRFQADRRKLFDDYCVKNGGRGILNFSNESKIHDQKSFTCVEEIGSQREEMKTVVIAPNGELYLTDGHHTFNGFWEMNEGGPDLKINLIISRDYRELETMNAFWEQMKAEQNVWLFDVNNKTIEPKDLPQSLGLKNFQNDQYRALMYFTRRIAWRPPREITVPDPDNYDDRYPGVPFLEFYWVREIMSKIDLKDYNLSTREGYLAVIQDFGKIIMETKTNNVGGSNKSVIEMGQFRIFNKRELARIDRPGTGKLAYMLGYKRNFSQRQSFN
ncbi:MAG: ParB/Srx family N-terminal domain-containing protein [Elusimicrobiota bacterium]